LTACAGGKLDSATNLCWQDPPSDSTMNWYRASGTYHADYNPDTVNHCGALDHGGRSDWRLPNMGELISLLRGCQNGTETGDLSTSLCEMNHASWTTTCAPCSNYYGPASGCYWDPAVGGTCGWYWSSSFPATNSSTAWGVYFYNGEVSNISKFVDFRVRCVRSGP
jgi:hypothetical protein